MRKKVSFLAVALAAVVLMAAALRLWGLPTLPPGLWYDEAVNGVDIRMILSGQGLPLYFAANSGREPLFIYLQALSVALFGPTPFSLRLVSAFVGVTTVAAVYLCATVIFHGLAPDQRRQTRWAALLAAAVLAVSYWHVSLSRLGLRAILLPLVSTIAITVFWRAWRGRRVSTYVWAGAWFGLSLYTYTSARLLPLVPALFVLTEMTAAWLGRRRGATTRVGAYRSAAPGIAVMTLAAVLVAAPLAAEAVRHPAIVLGRAGELAAADAEGSSRPASIAQNAVTVLRAFYDRGDANPRHNFPGRPATDPLTAILLTAGLLAAAWRVRDARSRLLLIWFGVMLLPSVLSEQAPHYLRAAGALPPYALLAGIGGWWISRLGTGRLRQRVLPALVVVTLLLGGFLTARDYFTRWPALPALALEFSTAEQGSAEEAAKHLNANARTYQLTQAMFRAPNLIYRLGAVNEQLGPVGQGVPAEPAGAGSTEGHVWRLNRQTEGIAATPYKSDGTPWQPEVPLDLTFGNGLRLVGYDVEPTGTPVVSPSSTVTVTLYWRAAEDIDPLAALSSEVFTHFVAGGAVRETANGSLPDNYRLLWPALRGLLVDPRVVVIPADTPEGKAYFEVGQYAHLPWQSRSAAKRIPLIDGQGNLGGDQVILAPLMVGIPAPSAELQDLTPVSARFEERIALQGWRADAAADGQTLTVRLCWTAERRVPTDLTAFVHLLDAGDNIVSQYDAEPGGLGNPTSRWTPGERVCSEHPLLLPPGGALPDYRLRVGLYEPVSGRQWRVEGPTPDNAATFLILRPGTGR